MKTKFRIWLAAAVIISSITCQTLLGGTSVQLDEVSLTEAEEPLGEIIAHEINMGDLIELDRDQNGRDDQIIYYYPEQEIATDILLATNLVFTSGELDEIPNPDIFHKELWLILNNQNPQEMHVQFIYEIPKEFAQHVDELTFNPEPVEVINPDPAVKYDVNVPSYQAGGEALVWVITGDPMAYAATDYVIAKLKLRQDALKQMKERCKSVPAEDKNDCYLSLITDFQDLLDQKEMENICSGEMTGVERRICLSIVKDSATECDRASTPENVHICKGFYVYQKCKGLDGGELQACLRDTAIANKAPLGCKNLEDPDVRNECYAKASGNVAYCARISNQARREGCEKALNAGAGQVDQSQPGPVSVDPSRWFNDDNANADCKPFAAIFPDYTLNYTHGDYFHDVAHLTCDMDANDPDLDDILYEVSIWIWAYDGSDTARQVWETDALDGYTYASAKQRMETNTNPNFTITLEAGRYFSFFKTERTDKRPTYSISGGALYKNARVAFLFDGYSESQGAWLQVEALFMQLIDGKNK